MRNDYRILVGIWNLEADGRIILKSVVPELEKSGDSE
jgi:hypothetical protein